MYLPLPPVPHARRFCFLFAAGGPYVASRTRTTKPTGRNHPVHRHQRGLTSKAVDGHGLAASVRVCVRWVVYNFFYSKKRKNFFCIKTKFAAATSRRNQTNTAAGQTPQHHTAAQHHGAQHREQGTKGGQGRTATPHMAERTGNAQHDTPGRTGHKAQRRTTPGGNAPEHNTHSAARQDKTQRRRHRTTGRPTAPQDTTQRATAPSRAKQNNTAHNNTTPGSTTCSNTGQHST